MTRPPALCSAPSAVSCRPFFGPTSPEPSAPLIPGLRREVGALYGKEHGVLAVLGLAAREAHAGLLHHPHRPRVGHVRAALDAFEAKIREAVMQHGTGELGGDAALPLRRIDAVEQLEMGRLVKVPE